MVSKCERGGAQLTESPRQVTSQAMTWFGKRPPPKRTFTDIAPVGLIDLHSHVLPGLDDGARSIGESIEILRELRALGFTRVVSTPHFQTVSGKPDASRQRRLIDDILNSADAPLPEVLTGAETLFDERFIEAERRDKIPTIGDHGAYLVEFGLGPGHVPPRVEHQAFKLSIQSKQLIVAHPERYADCRHQPEIIALLRKSGALMQMDLLSLVGYYGGEVKDAVMDLLDKGWLDLAATDIHRKEDLPHLEAALSVLADWSPETFERLLSDSPRRVLAGQSAGRENDA